MEGPSIVAASLSTPFVTDRHGRTWQYHSRSDRHSKVACWVVIFDLLQASRLLPDHVARGHVVFGLNHEMREFTTNRKKKLDLVLCSPREGHMHPSATFANVREQFGIVLNATQREALDELPVARQGEVGQVRIALEAKAAMTAHIRAIPRLFDELNSSHHTVHASSDVAIAGGLVMVNTAPTFVSSDLNKLGHSVPDVVSVNQPHGPDRVLEKIGEIPRRRRSGEDGFDALGVILVDMPNDGTAVRVVPGPSNGGSIFRYEQMIARLAECYDSRFA